jgi:hypothetical protein
MTNEEREAIHAGLTTIITILSDLQLKADALERTLAKTNPSLHTEYLNSLGVIPAAPISTALECLNKNLRKTFQ